MKKIVLTISAMMLCAVLFAAPSLSSLFPNFSAEKIDSLMKGNTVEAYTCYGDKIADIAPLGSLGRSKALTETGFTRVFPWPPFPSFPILTGSGRCRKKRDAWSSTTS
ncbi:MAG: hypothetical protein IIU49_02270 [Spirochaetales bacterium]|nr:hypothetical protein [Spirochaetales bacterium]